MRLIRDRLCLLALTFLLFAGACPLVGAQEDTGGVDDSPLRQKQEAQERANAMAEDLLERILDKQLQQLEENGLGDESF